MNLNGAKLITLLLTAGLLIVATLIKADEDVQPLFGHPDLRVNHLFIP